MVHATHHHAIDFRVFIGFENSFFDANFDSRLVALILSTSSDPAQLVRDAKRGARPASKLLYKAGQHFDLDVKVTIKRLTSA